MKRITFKAIKIFSKAIKEFFKCSFNKIKIGYIFILLAGIVVSHIICLFLINPRVSSFNGEFISTLDANIPFNLLMLGLVMASFVPMLVYSYTLSLVSGAKEKEISLDTRKNITKFRHIIDFIVNEVTLLIVISVLIGAFIFIETNIHTYEKTPLFLILYYSWYFLTAVGWSLGQFHFTYIGKKIKRELGNRNFRGYAIGLYSWISFYIFISILLVLRYKSYTESPNCVVWLKYLIVITSLWLLLFSVLWIIPAGQYSPLWRLMKDYYNGIRKS